ncbi:related to REX3 - RNA exonuclease, member of the family of 3` -5` exonucleases [Cephalotrichum gorgonifer]|uniref:Related to REX3 - RNA exonuclease, member of the family of 3` -5` exonucleases n=1 Tax=Cephalotrichum gorgonifer TaxID=2041049 RepID=A0AAE8SRC4_9PEZI|nr:related to REX3 - RNA exonuclease, member of the family of 3` -5` exonucleases [Cephalotrichum gorgonifer]
MSLNLLKHIPCPAGRLCTAFQCLFQHQEDIEAKEPPPSLEQSVGTVAPGDDDQASRKRKDGGGHSDTDSTRKRLKASDTGEDLLERSQSVILNPPISQNGALEDPESIKPASLRRPISPPLPASKAPTQGSPLRLGTLQQSPQPNTPETQTTAASDRQITPAHAPAATPLSSVKRPKPPAKTETLNPRLVKPAPATFESRFKLLRLVHSELSRLNKELKKIASGDGPGPSKQKAGTKTSVHRGEKTSGAQRDSKTANVELQGDKEKADKVLSDQQLITLALDEEENVALSRPTVYTTAMRGVLMKYKRMTPAQWEEVCVKEIGKTSPSSKEDEVSAKPEKEIITGLTSSQEVYILRRLLTPITSLSKHGYVVSIPNDEDIRKAKAAVEMAQNWEKCARCDRRFQVFPGRREEDGALTSGSQCLHHPGKTYFQERQPGDKSKQPKRYRCCGEAVGDTAGCTTGENHVFKVSDSKRLAGVINFAETPDNPKEIDYAVCFDCEMGYTVYGLELIRLTATAWPTGEVLLDILVRPKGEILDLNSRYSGVWPQDIVNAEPYNGTDASILRQETASGDLPQGDGQRKFKIVNSPEAARDLLFSLLKPDTPLVGHGLENDLNAVRIIHPTLVDTVLLYPHKLGLPYRQGLKMLAARYLEKHIQVDDTAAKGHDSAEDARAAGDLARLKVKEEWDAMKLRGWSIQGDEFVPPPSERA